MRYTKQKGSMSLKLTYSLFLNVLDRTFLLYNFFWG